MTATIRRYRHVDAVPTLRVFREAVRRGTAGRHDDHERSAWAPLLVDVGWWAHARDESFTFVAEQADAIVAFCSLTSEGNVEMLYVYPNHTRCGLARALLDWVEAAAKQDGMPRIHTLASPEAEGVFLAAGYTLLWRRHVALRDAWLPKAIMEKVLGTSEPLSF